MDRGRYLLILFGILGLGLVGCGTLGPGGGGGAVATGGKPDTAGATKQGNTAAAGSPAPAAARSVPAERPAAYVRGHAITRDALWRALLEADAGQTVAELFLDPLLADRLAAANLTVTPQLVDAERQIIIESLDEPDADRAALLLREWRATRGLGDERFNRLLRRNAALRLLVQPDVQVTDAALRQAFDLEYGPGYEARLIVADSLQEATRLARRARAGESFIDLAIRHSTDPSRAQGGLLPVIRPGDATFPDAVRQTLAKLKEGQVSDPVALEQSYAVLRLERQIAPQPVQFADVEGQLRQRVQRRIESLRMRQAMLVMLQGADPTILDPAVAAAWAAQQQRME